MSPKSDAQINFASMYDYTNAPVLDKQILICDQGVILTIDVKLKNDLSQLSDYELKSRWKLQIAMTDSFPQSKYQLTFQNPVELKIRREDGSVFLTSNTMFNGLAEELIFLKFTDQESNKAYCYPLGRINGEYNLSKPFLDLVNEFGKPVYGYITENELLRMVNCKSEEGVGKVYLREYANSFSPALPPMRFHSDDLQKLSLKEKRSIKTNYTFKVNNSLYYVSKDSIGIKGFAYRSFSSHYPMLKTVKDLKEPLIYILRDDEYNAISREWENKSDVDDIWLGFSGSHIDARSLIRVFYNRVKFSNMVFASFKEGWKTDRGMVYVLFGVPSKVYVSEDREEWVYSSNVKFTFVKVPSKLSDSNFILKRNESYEQIWYSVVESWRNGKIPEF